MKILVGSVVLGPHLVGDDGPRTEAFTHRRFRNVARGVPTPPRSSCRAPRRATKIAMGSANPRARPNGRTPDDDAPPCHASASQRGRNGITPGPSRTIVRAEPLRFRSPVAHASYSLYRNAS